MTDRYSEADASTATQTVNEREALRRGLAWTGALRLLAQLAGWGTTLVVARLLSPDDFGLAGLGAVWFAWSWAVAECGISLAITSGPVLPRDVLRSLHSAAILAGSIVALAVGLAAPALASWYGDARLGLIFLALVPAILLEASRLVPVAMLSRTLAFDQAAKIDFARAITQTATTLILAGLGAGFWAIIAALVTGSLAATLLATIYWPLRPAVRSFSWPRDVLRRSRVLYGGLLAWHAYRNGDVVMVGKIVDSTGLGYFTVARTVAWLPIEKLVSVLTSLTQSLFAHVREEPAELRQYLVSITEAVVLATTLPLAGLAATADLAIPLVLGAKWEASVPLVRVLIIPAIVSGVFAVASQVSMVRGGETRILTANVASALLTLAAYVGVGSAAGLLAGAASWAVFSVIVFMWFMHRLLVSLQMSAGQYLLAWKSGAVATAAMLTVVLGFRLAMAGRLHPAAELASAIALGSTFGVAAALRSESPVVRKVVQQFRSRLGR